jgi:3-oxoadipate enol-lactonase
MMATTQRDGLSIYYELIGTGPRLLVLNGSGASIESSQLLIGFLARHFTVLVHDQRGLGRTGLQGTTERPSMADYALDAKAVLDAMGWGQTAVFGLSFGGMVAQEFAVTWPGVVTRLALLSTSSGGAGGSSYPLHEMASMPPDERAQVALHNLDMRFTPEWLAEHPSDAALVTAMATQALVEKSEEVVRGEQAQLYARSFHDTWDRLGAISSPTFVGAGRYDGLAPLANAETMSRAIRDAVLEVYEGGHIFMAQDRRAMPAVAAFLVGPN